MDKKTEYYLDKEGNFIIHNYNLTKPFASFFPGIAGKYGIPLWVFYVNRNQGIIGFGTNNKNHAISEFFPANRAWHLVSSLGFRTFLRIVKDKKIIFYEPFNPGYINIKFELSNRMFINSWGLKIEETNFSLGLKTEVEFFTIPNDKYAGLARIVSITNLKNQPLNIHLLDGLPQIIPYGISNLFLKKLSRTIEAWMKAELIKGNVASYKIDIDPEDKPEVIHIKPINFYLSFYAERNKEKPAKLIIDPDLIFSPLKDFSFPINFYQKIKIPSEFPQNTESKTPCGFSFFEFNLPAKEKKEIFSIAGYMPSKEKLISSLERITNTGYLQEKREENKEIILQLQNNVHTESSSYAFDLYVKQTYLDNILRGGYPVIFKGRNLKTVFYIYGRKHGDLERDYNNFSLSPTYFSQGNGNYRDINQNRRMDIWFYPEIEEENILTFFNLIQADGFNPLVLKEVAFYIRDLQNLSNGLKNIISENEIALLVEFLKKPFSPGEVINFLEETNISPKVSLEEFLTLIISFAQKEQTTEHADGYWIDHWTYNLDLLENYLKIYPEKLKEIIFEKPIFTFYDNSHAVKPRKEKYFIKDGKVVQLHAVYKDPLKEKLIKERNDYPYTVRDNFGKGKIYRTVLINKLLCLLVNKLSSLDPFGMGIEMEADKPNWFDALNGLPHLLGSSLCETFELKRLVLFIEKTLKEAKVDKIFVTQEIYDFLKELDNLLKDWLNNDSKERDFLYWERSNSLKETYRQNSHFGFSGKENEISSETLFVFLENALKKIDEGIKKAEVRKGIFCAYFINEVNEYQISAENHIIPTKFTQKRLPLFLEGQMHALRLSLNIEEAKKIHQATRKSSLFDKKLKMYKVTASLKDAPLEIGRCRAFPSGWLENESIWLHMEYKYILETLKKGLLKEFYTDFKNVLIPFQNPQRYGRSILENCSFIVSSAFKDKNLIGNGFVAKLSGSTAEFLEIWSILNIGKEPFFLNEKNELNLRFQPNLAGWLFRKDKTYSFNFLSKIRVTYHNLKRKNTFGKNPAKIKEISFYDQDNQLVKITADTIPSPYAEQIRSLKIKKIDIYLE